MDIKIQILNRTRQGLDVFHHYLGVKFIPNRSFKNPLYNDTKASCSIYLNKKSGIYMMKDFETRSTQAIAFGWSARC